MTIQEQVEQFNRKWYLNDYHKTGLGYVEMKKDTSTLLRAVVEECRKQTRLDYDDKVIRRTFAWLEEK